MDFTSACADLKRHP